MLDAIRTAWLAFWAIPHIHWILAAGWVLYLFGLGLWIVLQKRNRWRRSAGCSASPPPALPGFLVTLVFGPQKLKRHRLRRSRNRVDLPRAGARAQETGKELARLGQATTHLPASSATGCACCGTAALYLCRAVGGHPRRDHIHLEYYILFARPHRRDGARRAGGTRAGQGEGAAAAGRARLVEGRAASSSRCDAGGELVLVPSGALRPHLDPHLGNMRTHRKIVVIDGAIGYTGGINVTDEENDALRADAYRDLHMRITGDVVRALQLTRWTSRTGVRDP